jgi:hypothetical protein
VQKPSAKNIILIMFAAAIIGVAFAVSKYENPAYTGQTGNVSQSNFQIPVITASATSTDGTIAYSGNWEKTLSTTMTSVWGGSTTSIATANATLTPTDVFGRDIFTRYMQAENSGQDVTDPNVQQAVAGQILSDGTVLPTVTLYSANDLKITPDNSVAAITAYGNAAGLVFTEFFMKHENELTIVQDSLNANNPATLKELDPIIAEYQGLLKGELAVTVPSTLESTHLTLVNSFAELIFADQGFEKTFSDGLTSLNALSAYKQGATDLDTAINGIKTALNVSNITYTTQDPGILFTYKSQ